MKAREAARHFGLVVGMVTLSALIAFNLTTHAKRPETNRPGSGRLISHHPQTAAIQHARVRIEFTSPTVDNAKNQSRSRNRFRTLEVGLVVAQNQTDPDDIFDAPPTEKAQLKTEQAEAPNRTETNRIEPNTSNRSSDSVSIELPTADREPDSIDVIDVDDIFDAPDASKQEPTRVVVAGGPVEIVISGVVPNRSSAGSILTAVQEAYPDAKIDDQLTVDSKARDSQWLDRFPKAIQTICSNLTTGIIDTQLDQLTVSGETAEQEATDRIRRSAKDLFPNGQIDLANVRVRSTEDQVGGGEPNVNRFSPTVKDNDDVDDIFDNSEPTPDDRATNESNDQDPERLTSPLNNGASSIDNPAEVPQSVIEPNSDQGNPKVVPDVDRKSNVNEKKPLGTRPKPSAASSRKQVPPIVDAPIPSGVPIENSTPPGVVSIERHSCSSHDCEFCNLRNRFENDWSHRIGPTHDFAPLNNQLPSTSRGSPWSRLKFGQTLWRER